MQNIWYYEWEESERGWGTRPNGLSLHSSADAAKAYLKAHWARQPKGPAAPDEYDRTTSDEPRVIQVEPNLAAWVKAQDRRIWHRQARFFADVTLEILDPEMHATIEQEGRALIEAACLDAAAPVSTLSGKRPTL